MAPFIVVGAFIVAAYNLELFGGRFHTDFWFAAAWGAFPALTSYWANALRSGAGRARDAGVLLRSAWRSGGSSTPVRTLRRRTTAS